MRRILNFKFKFLDFHISRRGAADDLQHDSISIGFRSVLGDPSVFLTELVWRWSFGAFSFFLLLLALLGSAAVTNAHSAAWESRDPFLITLAALRLMYQMDRRPLFILLALGVSAIWVVFGALGRTVILKRLSARPHDIVFRNILGLQAWRVVLLWVGFAGAMTSIMFCAWVAMHDSKPDYLIFYVMVFPLLAALGTLCWVVNWYLSFAAICADGNETSVTMAIQRAMVLARSQIAAVAAISLLFAALRVLAVLLAFVLIVFFLGLMASAPHVSQALIVAVLLAYCALADFLYVCRLTSYLDLSIPPNQQ